MKPEELGKVFKCVRPGTKLQLEFRKGHGCNHEIIEITLGFLVFFQTMLNKRHLVAKDEATIVILTAVIECRCWHYDRHRYFTVETTEHFDKKRFIMLIGPDLQSIKIVK